MLRPFRGAIILIAGLGRPRRSADAPSRSYLCVAALRAAGLRADGPRHAGAAAGTGCGVSGGHRHRVGHLLRGSGVGDAVGAGAGRQREGSSRDRAVVGAEGDIDGVARLARHVALDRVGVPLVHRAALQLGAVRHGRCHSRCRLDDHRR